MASIEERNGGFRVRWRTLANEPRSRQCPDRKTARALKAEVERAQALGREWSAPDSAGHVPGLDDLAAAYLVDCGRRLKRPSVERKAAILGLLLDSLSPGGVVPGVDAITREALHRWHAQLVTRVSRRTAAAYLYEAGRLWSWAADSDEWGALVSRPRKLDPGPVPPVPRSLPPATRRLQRSNRPPL